MEAGGVDSDGSEEEGGGGGGAAGDDDGGADDHEAAWLLEQNAWLMEELESKDGAFACFALSVWSIVCFVLSACWCL